MKLLLLFSLSVISFISAAAYAALCSIEPAYRLVFDSNQSGTFGIYTINLDGSNRRTLVSSDQHEMYPDVSNDGRWVVFTRSLAPEVGSPKDVWKVSTEGGEPRLLVENGSFPTFSADGQTVYFLRERRRVMSMQPDGSEVKEIFPLDVEPFAGREIALPRVSPDGRFLVFTVDYPNKWHTWIYDFKTKTSWQLGRGCQGVWDSDSESLLWVRRGRFRGVNAIVHYDLKSRHNVVFHDDADPFGMEYFPDYSSSNEILVWSACPSEQHSHETSNYQIFWRNPNSDKVHRVTNDAHTNRWPKVFRVPTFS